jgi:uncharacterized protein YkwD
MSATKRRFGLLAIVVSSAVAFPLAISPSASARDPLLAPAGVCPDPALSAPAQTQISAMLCYHQYARRESGLRILRTALPLYRSAAMKMRWIVACGRFTHTPCGRPFASAFSSANYTRGDWHVGENLAWGAGSRGRVREMFDLWLHSPPHRENISRPGWREIGISLVHALRLFGWSDVSLWIVHFGSH